MWSLRDEILSHPDLTPDQRVKRPLKLLCRQLRQPASVSHSPGRDDALLGLQESLQTRRADLEGQRPPAETRVSGEAAQGPRVVLQVGAGGDGVVLGHLPAAACRQRRGGGALAECRFWSSQGADGRRVKPF